MSFVGDGARVQGNLAFGSGADEGGGSEEESEALDEAEAATLAALEAAGGTVSPPLRPSAERSASNAALGAASGAALGEGAAGKESQGDESHGAAAALVDDEDRSSYEAWLSDLAPGDLADHPLLPIVWDEDEDF